MRKWLYARVKSCPGQTEFSSDRIFSSGSVDGVEADSPDKPFIVIRFSLNQAGLPRTKVRQQRFQVWLHTEPGSMLPTDVLCQELSEWLPSQAPAQFEDEWIMDCLYETTSSDGYDDHFKTETRYVEFLGTYRPASD